MWLVSISLGVILLTLWIIWRKRRLTYFKNIDIPGPEPSFFFGNYWDLLFKGQHKSISEWIEDHGRIFGYYHGLKPVLVVADLDFLRHILVKEFQKFSNRPDLFTVGRSNTKFNSHSLTVAQGKRWKELRSIITPTFTASKLKKMSPIINEAIDELLVAAEKASAKGQPFDIYHLYQNLTMDVIARTSMGIHTKAQLDEKNEPFVKLARLIFSFRMNILTMLTFSFTEIVSVFSIIRQVTLSLKNRGRFPRGEMLERTAEAIAARRQNKNYRRLDVLQLMMDAQRTEANINENTLTAGENEESSKKEITNQASVKHGKGMTDDEILQNSVLFLLAGYETTSTALAFMTYNLVYHQDVQDKVREEINANVSENEELSYDTVQKLPYLDAVLNESLRLYPPITYFVNRVATEDVVIENIRIPKGMTIQVPVYYIQHDPTIWEDPEKFNPDRFSAEEKRNHHPMAFQAFGSGPRNCIGMRFAQMEAKMAIAKLIRKYKLLPKKGTRKEDFQICDTIVTMRPDNGVVIQLEHV